MLSTHLTSLAGALPDAGFPANPVVGSGDVLGTKGGESLPA